MTDDLAVELTHAEIITVMGEISEKHGTQHR